MFRFLLALLPFLLSPAMTDSGKGEEGGDDEGDESADKAEKAKVEFTPEQLREVQRIAAKESRKAADKARQEEKDRIAQEKADADADAERKRQVEEGKFDEVRTSLERERDEARKTLVDRDSELSVLRTHVNGDIEAAVKDEAFKPFLRFDPGADAPIADRLKWLAEAKAGIAELPTPTSSPGNGPNPPPAGPGADKDVEDRARAAMRPKL